MYNKEIEEKTGIFVFNNLIDSDFCDSLIEKFELSKNKKKGTISFSNINENVKKSTDLYLSTEQNELIHNVHKKLKNAFCEITKEYKQLENLPLYLTGLIVQKSEKNDGFYKPHTDNQFGDLNYERFLAGIIYLNDVEEGGETRFYRPNIDIKPEKGKVVFFPATWKYLHEGCVPVSNDKYIITTFVVCNRNSVR